MLSLLVASACCSGLALQADLPSDYRGLIVSAKLSCKKDSGQYEDLLVGEYNVSTKGTKFFPFSLADNSSIEAEVTVSCSNNDDSREIYTISELNEKKGKWIKGKMVCNNSELAYRLAYIKEISDDWGVQPAGASFSPCGSYTLLETDNWTNADCVFVDGQNETPNSVVDKWTVGENETDLTNEELEVAYEEGEESAAAPLNRSIAVLPESGDGNFALARLIHMTIRNSGKSARKALTPYTVASIRLKVTSASSMTSISSTAEVVAIMDGKWDAVDYNKTADGKYAVDSRVELIVVVKGKGEIAAECGAAAEEGGGLSQMKIIIVAAVVVVVIVIVVVAICCLYKKRKRKGKGTSSTEEV